ATPAERSHMSPSKAGTTRPRRKAAPPRKAIAAAALPRTESGTTSGAALDEGGAEQVLRAFARAKPGTVSEPVAHPGVSLPYPQGGWRSVGFLLSLCQPAVGLLLAFLYWPATEGRARRFSRWCLVLALIGIAVLCLFGAAWAVFKGNDAGVQAW
ncbi:MAG: hypothetical protein ACREKE_10470, partial [bacterium]